MRKFRYEHGHRIFLCPLIDCFWFKLFILCWKAANAYVVTGIQTLLYISFLLRGSHSWLSRPYLSMTVVSMIDCMECCWTVPHSHHPFLFNAPSSSLDLWLTYYASHRPLTSSFTPNNPTVCSQLNRGANPLQHTHTIISRSLRTTLTSAAKVKKAPRVSSSPTGNVGSAVTKISMCVFLFFLFFAHLSLKFSRGWPRTPTLSWKNEDSLSTSSNYLILPSLTWSCGNFSVRMFFTGNCRKLMRFGKRIDVMFVLLPFQTVVGLNRASN